MSRGTGLLAEVADLDAWEDLLEEVPPSPEAVARSQGIRDEVTRRRAVASHSMLRRLIAGALDVEPSEVTVTHDDDGRPLVPGAGLWVSLSRRGRLCAGSAAWDGPCGVDVELVEQWHDLDDVASEYFPNHALDELRRAGSAAPWVFASWWTRIEAAAKAVGVGLESAAGALECTLQYELDGTAALGFAASVASTSLVDVEWRTNHLMPPPWSGI